MSVNIRGACGHTAPFESWRRGRFGGELPREHYRCPECGYYFKRVYVRPVFNEAGTDYVRRGFLTIHEKTPTGWQELLPMGHRRPVSA